MSAEEEERELVAWFAGKSPEQAYSGEWVHKAVQEFIDMTWERQRAVRAATARAMDQLLDWRDNLRAANPREGDDLVVTRAFNPRVDKLH